MQALASWFDRNQRSLPWRRPPYEGDPYAILVSEVMLQQTRVDTVVPYFEAWMARWPTIADLASADEQEVLAAWQGLGYYSRARRLHSAARAVVDQHGGELPRNPAALRELPGLGPYATGAVASIAFDVPLPAVDGNVARVVARLEGAEVDVREPAVRRRIHDRLEPLVPREGGAGAFNVALIELGATVCTPRAPRCDACPVESWCEASRTGRADSIPIASPRQQPTVERVAAFLVERADGAVLLRRRPADGLLGGLWGLPMEVRHGRETLRATAARVLEESPERVGRRVARVRHVFSHRVWEVGVHRVDVAGGAGTWANPASVDQPLSTLDRKLLAAVHKRAPARGKSVAGASKAVPQGSAEPAES